MNGNKMNKIKNPGRAGAGPARPQVCAPGAALGPPNPPKPAPGPRPDPNFTPKRHPAYLA